MKIKSVRIQNLRSIKDQTVLLDDYTCLVGANGAGKSTILFALDVFFRSTPLKEEDFHHRNYSTPIQITVTFSDLSLEAQEEFKHYYRSEALIVTAEAVYSSEKLSAPVRQFGEKMGISEFKAFLDGYDANLKAGQLGEIYTELSKTKTLPPAKTRDDRRQALLDYQEAHPEECSPQKSHEQFYGATRGDYKLEKYIQWVFVPAVKDASDEQTESKNSALGKILERTVRSRVNFTGEMQEIYDLALHRYEQVLQSNQTALDDLSTSLKRRLTEWSHPSAELKVEWWNNPEKPSIQVAPPVARILAGEHDFLGDIGRLGHGLQRSYLIALLQELADAGKVGGPKLILGCEEPELYQHPPQARHFAETLKSLPSKNSQVIVCSHSPFFVDGQDFERVRLVRKSAGAPESTVESIALAKLTARLDRAIGKKPLNTKGVQAKLRQALQPALNEIFFAPVVVLVEGLEDVAYITTYAELTGANHDFRRHGVHLVAANGKGYMIHPLAVANELSLPMFAIFDSDAHNSNPEQRIKHQNDNGAILHLCNEDRSNSLPTETLWGQRCVMWKSELARVIEADFVPGELEPFKQKARVACGNAAGVSKHFAYITECLTEAYEAGKRFPTLERLCKAIIEFAEKSKVPKPSGEGTT